jgi:hypothetical protein
VWRSRKSPCAFVQIADLEPERVFLVLRILRPDSGQTIGLQLPLDPWRIYRQSEPALNGMPPLVRNDERRGKVSNVMVPGSHQVRLFRNNGVDRRGAVGGVDLPQHRGNPEENRQGVLQNLPAAGIRDRCHLGLASRRLLDAGTSRRAGASRLGGYALWPCESHLAHKAMVERTLPGAAGASSYCTQGGYANVLQPYS